MNVNDFNELRKEIFKKSMAITESKGRDYTKGDADVLKNFKEGADFFGVQAEQYLAFALKKHNDAIYSYIKYGGQSESEPISERIIDAINYLIFLQAIIKEKEAKSTITE